MPPVYHVRQESGEQVMKLSESRLMKGAGLVPNVSNWGLVKESPKQVVKGPFPCKQFTSTKKEEGDRERRKKECVCLIALRQH